MQIAYLDAAHRLQGIPYTVGATDGSHIPIIAF